MDMEMEAHNTISESCCAKTTLSLSNENTKRLDYAATGGQAEIIGEFKKGHELMVNEK